MAGSEFSARGSAAQSHGRGPVQTRRLFFRVVALSWFVPALVHAAAAIPAALAATIGSVGTDQRTAGNERDKKQSEATSAQGLNGHCSYPTEMLWPFYSMRRRAHSWCRPNKKGRPDVSRGRPFRLLPACGYAGRKIRALESVWRKGLSAPCPRRKRRVGFLPGIYVQCPEFHCSVQRGPCHRTRA